MTSWGVGSGVKYGGKVDGTSGGSTCSQSYDRTDTSELDLGLDGVTGYSGRRSSEDGDRDSTSVDLVAKSDRLSGAKILSNHNPAVKELGICECTVPVP